MKKLKEIPTMRVLNWLNRYGSLCEFFDETTGYGTYLVSLHGRHAVNVSRSGKKVALLPNDYRVIAYNVTAGA